MRPTNAWEIQKIPKGKPSPYDGVLVPPMEFGQYELDSQYLDKLKQEKLIGPCPDCNCHELDAGLGGVVLGVLLSVAAMSLVHH